MLRGTVTQHAATYRPVGLMTVWANYPLGSRVDRRYRAKQYGRDQWGCLDQRDNEHRGHFGHGSGRTGSRLSFLTLDRRVFTTVSSSGGLRGDPCECLPGEQSQTQQEWMAGAAPG